jgi:hypothetical protein
MMNRPILIVLAILVLGSAGFGLVQLDELRKLRQNLSALDQERLALQKRIWDLQKRNGELERRLSRGSVPAAGADAPALGDLPPGIDPPADGQRFRGRPDFRSFANAMANPEVQKLMAVQQKAALDSRYASLFKQLQLNPDDLEKFKNLLVEKQTAVMDVMAAARAEGLTGPASRDQLQQLVQSAQAEVDNSIKASLGDAAYAQYQTYEATLPERNVVTQLDTRLSYSSTPLTDAQSAQLVQLLAQNAPANANAGNGTGGLGQLLGRGGAGGSTPITNEVVAQAQSVLNALQLAALQSLQTEQQAAALLRQQMRAAAGGGQGQGAATPTGSTPKPATPAGPGGG